MVSSAFVTLSVASLVTFHSVEAFQTSSPSYCLLSASRLHKFSNVSPLSATITKQGELDDMSSLRQRLLQGGKSYGPMLLSDSPIIAELIASIGYSHVVIDHEHSCTNIRSGQQMLQAVDAAATATRSGYHRTHPIVRLPSSQDTTYFKKVLDSMKLPGGVLVPMVDNASMAEHVVKSCRYPFQQIQVPNQEPGDSNSKVGTGGIRGCAAPFVRATGWGLHQNNEEYLKQCEEDLLIIVQVETMEGVRNIKEIANVDGVDMIFLGPFDLSTDMGLMGKFHDKTVQELLSHAEQEVLSSNCLLGGFRPPNRSIKDMFHTSNYSFVCGSVDLGLLRDAAMNDCQEWLSIV